MNKDIFDLLFYKKKYGPSQNYFELRSMVSYIQSYLPNPECIVEIGTFRGGTLRFWQKLLAPGGLLISVDLNDRGCMYEVKEDYKMDPRVQFITGDSAAKETIHDVKRLLGTKMIDILFIDGNHNYDYVKKDYDNYGKNVRSGGLIVLHDLVNPAVAILWKQMLKSGLYKGYSEFYGKTHPCGIGIFEKE